ncbi:MULTISPECIES: hypothetical protein [Citricoccus]|uniref:hypothetical protein n=1 Tax=Citricoccus TaxID=169133 RepID=UPI000255F369|nr:hypothetical protein [Citricoccus sp. CH26A]
MTTHDPYPHDPYPHASQAHDPEAQALEDEITRGTLHDRHRDHEFDGTSGRGSTATVGTRTAPEGIRTGTLVWGIIALLVALWSLSATVLDWDVDPALVLICLAALGGLVLVAGGIAGATRKGR